MIEFVYDLHVGTCRLLANNIAIRAGQVDHLGNLGVPDEHQLLLDIID